MLTLSPWNSAIFVNKITWGEKCHWMNKMIETSTLASSSFCWVQNTKSKSSNKLRHATLQNATTWKRECELLCIAVNWGINSFQKAQAVARGPRPTACDSAFSTKYCGCVREYVGHDLSLATGFLSIFLNFHIYKFFYKFLYLSEFVTR